MKKLIALFFISLWTSVGWSLQGSESVPLVTKDVLRVELVAPPLQLEPHQNFQLKLKLQLPDGYKAFVDQFKLRSVDEDFLFGTLNLEPSFEFFDKFSKRNRLAVSGIASLTTTAEAPERFKSDVLQLEVTYQACTETYCLFPQTTILEWRLPLRVAPTGKLASSPSSFLELPPSLLKTPLVDLIEKSFWLTLVVLFIMGFLTSLTPCVFPMIPITLSVLGREAHARTKSHQLALSLLYVLGIALTYATLGVVAALTGQLFGSFLAHPAVNIFIVLVFVLMALSLFGLFEVQLPLSLANKLSQHQGQGYLGAFVAGLISGVVASPCVGPILVSVLTLVAQSQDTVKGFVFLFVYAIGMGQLFILLGLTSRSTKWLPKSGPWLEGVKHILGFLMLGTAFYFLQFSVSQTWWNLLLGLSLFVLALSFGALASLDLNAPKWLVVKNYFYKALLIFSLLFVGFGLKSWTQSSQPLDLSTPADRSQWISWSQSSYDLAKANNKPILIDFYADWCAACKELELLTFQDPEVKKLFEQFTLLKFDATKSSEELKILQKKYGIVGLPTLVFYDHKGVLLPQLTLTEFEPALPFANRLKKIIALQQTGLEP